MHRAGQRCFELLALIGSPQLLQQSYFPAGQDSWPNWTNLKGLHSGRGFLGNKRFFTYYDITYYESYDFPGVDHERRQTLWLCLSYFEIQI